MCAQKTKTNSASSIGSLQTLGVADFSSVPERVVNKIAFAVYIRTLLQNWRQGTVGCKGRADVNFTNKKPWKQKGTGRARAGSARSPLWIGGGVTFGPQPRTRTLKVSKSHKRGVMNSLFWEYVKNGKIGTLDWQLNADAPKTAEAIKILQAVQMHGKRITMFLPVDDMLHYASFINIPKVSIVFFDDANAYSLARGDHWIVLKRDVESFKKMVMAWN